jgi:hypothetical protein
MDQEEDAVKEMNTMVEYAKTAIICNRQIQENIRKENEYKEKRKNGFNNGN